MNAIAQQIFQRYRGGNQIILLTGRSLRDLDLDADGNIRPLHHIFAAFAAREHKMGTLLHTLALGPRWDLSHFPNRGEADTFRRAVAQVGLECENGGGSYERPPHERALLVLRSFQQALTRDKVPPMLLAFEYFEDVVGDVPGLPADVVLQLGEMIGLLSGDYNSRRHPVFVVLTCEFPECLPERILRNLVTVHIPNPDRVAKKAFVQALKASSLRQNAKYEKGVDDDVVANLTDNTPNSGLERVFLESAKLGRPICEADLLAQKREDILRLSMGTLSLVDARRVRDVRLKGRMVQKALSLLRSWGQSLKVGNPHVPRNVLLCGAPATSKTDMAMILGDTAGVNMLQLLSPKGSLVGQTERQARLQWRCLRELAPNIGFIDEITEAFPVSRSQENLDGGASAAVHAELLTTLSDKSRAGKNMLLATTNIPFKIGSALRSRFVVLPIISAILEDYAAILVALARTLEPGLDEALENDAQIREAARIFFEKGCSPRVMRESLVITAGLVGGPLNPAVVLDAARFATESTERDRISGEYADLFALKLVTDRRFLPWADSPEEFPYPGYLKGIVLPDGSLNQERLNARLDELKSRVDL